MQLDRAAQNQRLAELAIGLLAQEPTPAKGIKALINVACELAKHLSAHERTALAHHIVDEAMSLNPRRN